MPKLTFGQLLTLIITLALIIAGFLISPWWFGAAIAVLCLYGLAYGITEGHIN